MSVSYTHLDVYKRQVRELIGAGSLFGHQILPLADAAAGKAGYEPVSYTHLDVYKRQYTDSSPVRGGSVRT